MYILDQLQTSNYNRDLIDNRKLSLRALYKYLIVFYAFESS